MILEMVNHLLCFVPVVHVLWEVLEFCPPGLSDDPFEVCAGLVIPDVEIHREPSMFIRLSWEGLLQNQVPLRVISNHDILVAC